MLAGFFSSLLTCSCQPGELLFHRVNSCQVVPDVVAAALLLRAQAEAARHIGAACCGAAEVDDGSQTLLLPERDAATRSQCDGM